MCERLSFSLITFTFINKLSLFATLTNSPLTVTSCRVLIAIPQVCLEEYSERIEEMNVVSKIADQLTQ